MPHESAIIVPVGEAEAIVGPLRMQHDPSAALGVPAHITLLYPFPPSAMAEAQIENLAEIFRGVPAFAYSLIEVRRFARTAYLQPELPERFTNVIDKLLETWPDCRPYRGAFPEIVPHLTVADRAEPDVLKLVEESLADHLPISCTAKEAWLLFSDDTGFWQKRECFPFTTS